MNPRQPAFFSPVCCALPLLPCWCLHKAAPGRLSDRTRVVGAHQLYKAIAKEGESIEDVPHSLMIARIEAAMRTAGGDATAIADAMERVVEEEDKAAEGASASDRHDEWIDVSWSTPGFVLDMVSCCAGAWEGYSDFTWIALQLHRQTAAGYLTAAAAAAITAFSTVMFLVGDKVFQKCARGKPRDTSLNGENEGESLAEKCDRRYGKLSDVVVMLLTLFQLRVQVEGMVFYRNIAYEAEAEDEADAADTTKRGCCGKLSRFFFCHKRRIRRSKYETLKSKFDRSLLQEGIFEALPQLVLEWQNLFQPGFTTVYRVMPMLYMPGIGNLLPYVSEYFVMSVISFMSAFLGVIDITTPYTPESGLVTIGLLVAGLCQLFGRMMFFVALLCVDGPTAVVLLLLVACFAGTWMLVQFFHRKGMYHPHIHQGKAVSLAGLSDAPTVAVLAFVNMFVPTDGNLYVGAPINPMRCMVMNLTAFELRVEHGNACSALRRARAHC